MDYFEQVYSKIIDANPDIFEVPDTSSQKPDAPSHIPSRSTKTPSML